MCSNFHLCESAVALSTSCVCGAKICVDCQRKLMSCTECAICLICKSIPVRTDSRRLYCDVCDVYCCNECCWRCESGRCKKKVCVMQRLICRVCLRSVCYECLSKEQFRVCNLCEESKKSSNEMIFEIDPVK